MGVAVGVVKVRGGIRLRKSATRFITNCDSSLHSKRFRASSSRKLGREQKKKGRGGRAITRLETLATQAIAIGIINCDDYYKLRQYSSTEPVSRLPGVLH